MCSLKNRSRQHVEDARRVVETANGNWTASWLSATSCATTPRWQRLIAEARDLGGPYVFRMNLNQQSDGAHMGDAQGADANHVSPIVDCGVHYVDVMCQITDAKPRTRQRHGAAPVRRNCARYV